MNEAQWTVTEGAELARERREGFVLSKEFFRRAKVQTALVVVGVAVLGTAVFHVLTAYRFGDEGMVMFAIAVLSLGSIPLAAYWEKRQAARYAAEPEMQVALRNDGRLVSIIVRQGDAPTGEDWGMLWFEDGRLYFSGRRTSFGLVPGQTVGYVSLEDAVAGVRHRSNLVLRRAGPVGPASISIAPIVSDLTNPDVAVGALRADLDRWHRGRVSGEGQWPPLTLGPCVVSERQLLTRALTTTFVLPIVLALFLLAISAPLVALTTFLLAMAVLSFAPTSALVWRAWWARRRLRRLEVREGRLG